MWRCMVTRNIPTCTKQHAHSKRLRLSMTHRQTQQHPSHTYTEAVSGHHVHRATESAHRCYRYDDSHEQTRTVPCDCVSLIHASMPRLASNIFAANAVSTRVSMAASGGASITANNRLLMATRATPLSSSSSSPSFMRAHAHVLMGCGYRSASVMNSPRTGNARANEYARTGLPYAL